MYKDKEKQKQYQQEWYQKNKQSHNEVTKKHRNQLQDWLRDYKATLKCNRCEESHPACLQFHHLDPKEKESSIRGAVRDNWSIEHLKQEIAKCEVVCANCHFKEHWQCEGL